MKCLSPPTKLVVIVLHIGGLGTLLTHQKKRPFYVGCKEVKSFVIWLSMISSHGIEGSLWVHVIYVLFISTYLYRCCKLLWLFLKSEYLRIIISTSRHCRCTKLFLINSIIAACWDWGMCLWSASGSLNFYELCQIYTSLVFQRRR